ncbi:MAG: sialidase family protein [Vicinamibacterales bacterium]|nr:sialidase family protein [Vicinamibacterales bacterium]
MFAAAVFAASASIVFSGVQPQLAAIGERVYLVFGQGDLISVIRSSDGGETFGKPSSLPGSGKLALGMRRGPRIAATSDAVLVAAVAGAKGGGADGDVLLYRSTDRGATWSAPVAINDVPGSAREGLHAIVASPTGVVVVAWLDLREKGTRIYAAVSRDHGATWAPDSLVYASPSGTVCECCHPSVAIGADGRVAIMFRNSLSGNRDIYVAESNDGVTFTSATKLGTVSWALNACPMDGGAVSFSADGVVATWRREGDVFLTTDRGPERRLGAGRDPVVAHFQTRRDVAWSASDGVVLVRNEEAHLSLGRGRFPSLVALRDKTVIAWEHEGQVMLRVIPR